MQKVPVGPSTVAGGTVTIASFATAVAAYASGARDEVTISMLVLGGVTLLTTLAGRFAQAYAHARTPEPVKLAPPVYASYSAGTLSSTAGAMMPEILTKKIPPAGDLEDDLDKDPPAPDPDAKLDDLDDPGLKSEILFTPAHTGLKD